LQLVSKEQVAENRIEEQREARRKQIYKARSKSASRRSPMINKKIEISPVKPLKGQKMSKFMVKDQVLDEQIERVEK